MVGAVKLAAAWNDFLFHDRDVEAFDVFRSALAHGVENPEGSNIRQHQLSWVQHEWHLPTALVVALADSPSKDWMRSQPWKLAVGYSLRHPRCGNPIADAANAALSDPVTWKALLELLGMSGAELLGRVARCVPLNLMAANLQVGLHHTWFTHRRAGVAVTDPLFFGAWQVMFGTRRAVANIVSVLSESVPTFPVDWLSDADMGAFVAACGLSGPHAELASRSLRSLVPKGLGSQVDDQRRFVALADGLTVARVFQTAAVAVTSPRRSDAGAAGSPAGGSDSGGVLLSVEKGALR